jgi:hypothetical protein
MNVILIEEQAYELMKQRFNLFVDKINQMCREKGRMEKWLTSEDVCGLLCISKRTLQNIRSSGSIPYSLIGHKVYYKASDVEKYIKNLTKNNTKNG